MPTPRWRCCPRVLLAAVLPFLPGCGEAPAEPVTHHARQPRDPAADSHARMLALLADIAARAPAEHPFYGSRTAETLRQELQRQGPRASWKLRRDLGIAELQLGREREGLAVLQQAHEAVDPADTGARTSLDFYLAVGWLRLAETENCCAQHAPESCILPLRGAAIHTRPEGSRNAIRHLESLLAVAPESDYWHLAARWLLNLAHMTLGEWPDGVPAKHRLPAATFATDEGFPRLPNIAGALGLDTMSTSGGAVADDFDGDGRLDLLVSSWAPDGQIRLWRNRGDGSFEDRTAAAGLTGLYGGLNLLQADYDNDGDLDFFVLRGAWLFEHGRHPNSLVRNNGDLTFTDVTFLAGMGGEHWPTQCGGWADFDGDGDLDLFVGNESSERLRSPSQLWRNDGDGTFTDVAAMAGVQNHRFSKGVAWGDVDGDGRPDLYVSNLGQPNRLYRNRGDGTFEDVAAAAGVTAPEQGFPCWFWDFDNDGRLDLFASAYITGIGHLAAHHLGLQVPYEVARIYRGDGKGGFRDVAREMGFTMPTMPMGSNFGDLDNDGWPDFYLGTGDTHYYSLMPNVLMMNRGGRAFVDRTMTSGMGHLQKGHGIAFADLDQDGDLDVFEQMGGAYPGDAFRDALYENPGFGNRWLQVQLVGTRSNRSAIGARIRAEIVEDGVTRSVYRHVGSGGSFGCNPLRQTLGLGRAEALARLEVFWPTTGTMQVVEGAGLDRVIRVTEGRDGCEVLDLPAVPFRR